MRRRGRRDGNHRDLVRALRQIGASVQDLADVGGGCPDLLVGLAGRTVLLEVKDGNRPPSERRLTVPEEEWIDAWRGGPVAVVENLAEAVAAATGDYERLRQATSASLPPQNANTGHAKSARVRRRVLG